MWTENELFIFIIVDSKTDFSCAKYDRQMEIEKKDKTHRQ